MYPHDVHVAGLAVSVWNVLFVVGVVLGWLVFLRLARRETAVSAPTLRFFAMAYLSALAAQLFAYAFDVNTSMTPPYGRSLWEFYLSPVAGPKTLYGVIVLMPVAVGIASLGCRLSLARALDLWTRPMLVALSAARVGCLLQGCCFGARSDLFGLSFPAGSPVYGQQRMAGLVSEAAAWSLPVVPTQALEAAVLAGLVACGRFVRNATRADGSMFLFAVIAYSVFRFTVEFVRADSNRGIYAGLATSQWIALVVLAGSTFAAARMIRPRRVFGSATNLSELVRP